MYSSNPNAYDKYSSGEGQEYQTTTTTITTTGFPVSTSGGGTQYSAITQPAYAIRAKVRVSWSTGLWDCFSDFRNCCITFWCPCITFGQIAEIVDKGSTSCGASGALYTIMCCVTGCACCYSCFYRAKMRQQHSLKESPCCDCLVHCFCEHCALCQEYRELQNQGYDMSIGWHGNVERRNRGVEMAPVIEGGMNRY